MEVDENQTAPDKNDLENCYAYPKLLDGDLRIYFGCDRYATDGDSDVAWWFFQSDVAPITSGPDTGKFSGVTTIGDILVLTHFTSGGKVPDIKIRRLSAIDNHGNVSFTTIYDSTTAGGSADCTDASVNPLACSTVNSGAINVDWTYIAKFPPAAPNNVPPGAFWKAGSTSRRSFYPWALQFRASVVSWHGQPRRQAVASRINTKISLVATSRSAA